MRAGPVETDSDARGRAGDEPATRNAIHHEGITGVPRETFAQKSKCRARAERRGVPRDVPKAAEAACCEDKLRSERTSAAWAGDEKRDTSYTMRVSRESREKLSHKNRSVGRGRRGGVPHETFRKPRRRRAAKLNCEAGGRAPRARHRLAGRAAQTQHGNSRVNGVGGPRRGTHGRSAEKFWRKKKTKKTTRRSRLDGVPEKHYFFNK